jgi:hypothetical protein
MHTQGRIDRGEMLGAFGQDQGLPSQPIGIDDFRDDAGRASVIDCQRSEDLLDARIGWDADRRRLSSPFRKFAHVFLKRPAPRAGSAPIDRACVRPAH